MYLDNKNSVKLSELIHWVKQELLSEETRHTDPVPLFVIDEVTLEVNFVLTGEGQGGFDVKVVKAGAKVTEERVQKATIKMKPLVPYNKLAEEFANREPHLVEQVMKQSVKVLLRGRTVEDDEDEVPELT